MKLIRLSGAATILLLLACLWTSAQTPQNLIDGHWEGIAEITGQDIELRLDLKTEAGKLQAIMDIPESALRGFPVPTASFDSPKLHLEVPANWGLAMFRDIGLRPEQEVIVFDGEVRNDAITGSLRLSNFSTQITLRRGYPTVPYKQEEVTFQNGKIKLAGTLLLPRTKAPHPVIVFTHGSGGTTRMAHQYEADLLARQGIASLIYDKRGTGESTSANWEVASFVELADDALAGVRFLLGRKDIDHKQIGMFGLSQGTYLIAMDAARSKDIAFIISVSGSGIAVWEQDIFRTEHMMRLRGYSEEDITEASDLIKQKFAVGSTGLGWEALEAKVKGLREKNKKWLPDFVGGYSSLGSARFWWIAVFSYDPAIDLEKITVPVLTLLGEKDLSFPVKEVAARMERAFRKGGNKDYTFHIFPETEHQMMASQEMNGQRFRRRMVPEYVNTMTEWLLKHVKVSK